MRGWRWVAGFFLFVQLVGAGIVRADPAAPAAGARVAAALERRLGPAAEWAAVAQAPPEDPGPAAAAALAAWLDRRLPDADLLVRAGLPAHMARRALAQAGAVPPQALWDAVQADLAEAARHGRPDNRRLTLHPPDPGAPAAYYGARARLFWYAYEQALPGGADALWAAVAAAAAAPGPVMAPPDAAPVPAPPAPAPPVPAEAPVSRRLAAGVPDFWDRYAAASFFGPPPPPPVEHLLADPDGDGLATGLERELGTDPQAADTAGDGIGDGRKLELGLDPRVRQIAVQVDGRLLTPDTPPVLVQDRVLVPMRALFTALGAQVEWDEGLRRVIATLGPRRVELTVGRLEATVRAGAGAPRRLTLAVAPALRWDRVYVPLRFVAESLGARVEWDGAARTVRLAPGGAPAAGTTPPPADAGAAPAACTAYLTFDDGPGAELTPKVLDVLKEHGVPATFFLVGRNVQAHSDLVRRMVAEGHGLGNHSWDHDYQAVYASPAEFGASLDRANAAIQAATGAPVRLARAPGGTGTRYLEGKDRSAYWAEARRRGYALFDWNVTIGDALPGPARGPDDLFATLVREAAAAAPGPYVVLMHDHPPHHGATLAVLPQVIGWFRDQGCRFYLLAPPGA